jgi:hypothetical protein
MEVLMKMLLLALTLVPTLALAELDDSVFNGTSSSKQTTEFNNDFSDRVGASLVKDETRLPASDNSDSKEFKFPVDGYDTGTSVQ